MRRTSMVAVSAAAVISMIVVPGCASAQPQAGGAPDMSGFADVTNDFSGPGARNAGTIALFSTPDGLSCGASLDGGLAHCTGALPGVANLPIGGSTQGSCDLGLAQVTSGGTAFINHYKGNCPAPSGLKVLSPGQKLSGGGITCGVADGGVTACVSGPHGFVLQPSGSSSF